MKKLFQKIWKHKVQLGLLILIGIISLAFCDWYVSNASTGLVYSAVEDTPARKIAIVLGTAKYVRGGRINLYYYPRIDAAAKLFKSGKVKGIVVSGDNSSKDYDEPSLMKEDLVKLGVPEKYITCDYAGFSTYDSIHRLERVFQETDYIVISQDFHVRRALFIGQNRGHNAVGLSVKGPRGLWKARVRLREVLARVKAVLDVHVLKRDPYFLGKLENVCKKAL